MMPPLGDAREDPDRVIVEAVPVLEHVEEAGANDRTGTPTRATLLADLARDAVLSARARTPSVTPAMMPTAVKMPCHVASTGRVRPSRGRYSC